MSGYLLDLDHVIVLYDIYEATKELDADTRLKILEAACIQLEQLEKEEANRDLHS